MRGKAAGIKLLNLRGAQFKKLRLLQAAHLSRAEIAEVTGRKILQHIRLQRRYLVFAEVVKNTALMTDAVLAVKLIGRQLAGIERAYHLRAERGELIGGQIPWIKTAPVSTRTEVIGGHLRQDRSAQVSNLRGRQLGFGDLTRRKRGLQVLDGQAVPGQLLELIGGQDGHLRSRQFGELGGIQLAQLSIGQTLQKRLAGDVKIQLG